MCSVSSGYIDSDEIEEVELASNPCFIGEVNELYGGYADMNEVKTILLSLLAAERAGAQVCAFSLDDASSEDWKSALIEVHKDEVASCKLIIDCLESLNIIPHDEVGDFVEKCMSISDFIERMSLLNKGQAWVVRKLDEILPRLQSEPVRGKLLQMKKEHQENIATMEGLLST